MDGEGAVVGLTANDPAISAEIARVDLPHAGSSVKAGESVATVVF